MRHNRENTLDTTVVLVCVNSVHYFQFTPSEESHKMHFFQRLCKCVFLTIRERLCLVRCDGLCCSSLRSRCHRGLLSATVVIAEYIPSAQNRQGEFVVRSCEMHLNDTRCQHFRKPSLHLDLYLRAGFVRPPSISNAAPVMIPTIAWVLG